MNTVMKKGACGLLLLLGSHVAFADCQLSVSQHNVDYGNIKNSDVKQSGKKWNALPDRTLQLSAWCTEPHKMALFFDGKVGDKGAMTFGQNSAMLMVASGALLDGKPVSLNHTTNRDIFSPAGHSDQKHIVRSQQGLIPVQGSEILSGKQFSVTLTVKPEISSTEFAITDKSDLMSHIHISVETN
ncbi:hypothetical protein [Lelliottia sp.]|uniref:hypothetical protein n=1 Tax=Lelliottia sp. TaxID=1898429 RepID=UPI00388DE763